MWWLDSGFSKCQQFSVSYNMYLNYYSSQYLKAEWCFFLPIPPVHSSSGEHGVVTFSMAVALCCAGKIPCHTAFARYSERSLLGNKWFLSCHICFSFRQQLPRSWQFWLPARESRWHVYEWLHAWATAVTSPRHAEQHGSSRQTSQSPHAGICK